MKKKKRIKPAVFVPTLTSIKEAEYVWGLFLINLYLIQTQPYPIAI